jgi:uncharacterized glyoxalase superfamily protein PhnB
MAMTSNQQTEMIETTRLTGVAPVLLVRDVVAASAYYRDRLGFETQLWNDPPDFCIAQRDGIRIMLAQVDPAQAAQLQPHWRVNPSMWNAYFWVKGIDTLYEEFRGRGATIDYTIGNKPYAVREFGIQDVDGHDIAFGEVI